MLYLEQPAGVGYSIAVDEEAFHHNDFTQSLDTLEAVK
jgi:carboxypeptidase C (cathepsin A)